MTFGDFEVGALTAAAGVSAVGGGDGLLLSVKAVQKHKVYK